MTLGIALSDEFTLYIPDRRGRGLSGKYGENYSMQKEVEDLDAIIKTGAHNIFGSTQAPSYCSKFHLNYDQSTNLPFMSIPSTLTIL